MKRYRLCLTDYFIHVICFVLTSYPWVYCFHNKTFSTRWYGSPAPLRVSIISCYEVSVLITLVNNIPDDILQLTPQGILIMLGN